MNELEIIYEDEHLVSVNKPHGLLVHRTPLAKDAKEFALQMLRNQLGGQHVYPVHRLDRKTSGVLVFAKDENTNAYMQGLFRDRQVKKVYKALVRGHISDEGVIDYPLSPEGSNLDTATQQEAMTAYNRVKKYEIDKALGKHSTSRYSLVALRPDTGRYHQLRKHMAHIYHPIIGDRPHGCNKQNRMWKHELGMDKMFLHAESISFDSQKREKIEIRATPSSEFLKALSFLSDRAMAE